MEILGIEKFRAAILKPFGAGERLALGTMAIGTRVVGVALVAALIAPLQMAAERGRSTKLDGSHDAPLRRGHRRAMLLSIGFAVLAEHIRHFQFGALHGAGAQKC